MKMLLNTSEKKTIDSEYLKTTNSKVKNQTLQKYGFNAETKEVNIMGFRVS